MTEMSKKITGRQSITRGNVHKEAFIEFETFTLDEFRDTYPLYSHKTARRAEVGVVPLNVRRKDIPGKKDKDKDKKEKKSGGKNQ